MKYPAVIALILGGLCAADAAEFELADGSVVYVGLEDTNEVRKFSAADLTLLQTTDLGGPPMEPERIYAPLSIAVDPNDPDTRDGVVQPKSLSGFDTGNRIVYSDVEDRLYGIDSDSTAEAFHVIDIVADGLEAVDEIRDLVSMELPSVMANGVVYGRGSAYCVPINCRH